MRRSCGPAGGYLVPIEPLRGWIKWQYPTLTNLALAHLIGHDEAHVRRWLTGPCNWISDANVDLILTRLGHPYMLRELYPELDGIAA